MHGHFSCSEIRRQTGNQTVIGSVVMKQGILCRIKELKHINIRKAAIVRMKDFIAVIKRNGIRFCRNFAVHGSVQILLKCKVFHRPLKRKGKHCQASIFHRKTAFGYKITRQFHRWQHVAFQIITQQLPCLPRQ